MERVKEFSKDQKKTAILGLIFNILAIIMLFQIYRSYGIIYGLRILISESAKIGIIVYFAIVLSRLYNKKGNINIANSILIILSVINTVFMNMLFAVINIIFILYLCNILLNKVKLVNNKIFAIAIIIGAAFRFISMLKFFNTTGLIFILSDLAIIPYFYNYYELLNGAKEDANKEELEAMGIIGNEKVILTPETESDSNKEENQTTRKEIYEMSKGIDFLEKLCIMFFGEKLSVPGKRR